MFGDYCFMVVAPDTPYFLNMPPHLMNDPAFSQNPDRVFASVAWPTPFWAKKDSWPVSMLDFHPVHNSAWPMAHLKAGMGELKFLNWCMSFMLGHIWSSARNFIAIKKSAAEEVKNTILRGNDMELIEIDAEHGTIKEVVEFLEQPSMQGDIWKVIDAVEKNFDKRVGLTELMYGTTGVQLRSAAEADIKQQNMTVRPQDMAKQVEGWEAEIAAKECTAARYHLHGNDVRPQLGDMGAWAWDTYFHTTDVQAASHELDYSIESGSIQRPNKEAEIRQATESMQVLLPVFEQYAQQTGDLTPLNNLISDYAKSRDLDPSRYQLSAPLPPPQIPQQQGGPDATQQVPTDNPVPAG
jgi:hypothetical protein